MVVVVNSIGAKQGHNFLFKSDEQNAITTSFVIFVLSLFNEFFSSTRFLLSLSISILFLCVSSITILLRRIFSSFNPILNKFFLLF